MKTDMTDQPTRPRNVTLAALFPDDVEVGEKEALRRALLASSGEIGWHALAAFTDAAHVPASGSRLAWAMPRGSEELTCVAAAVAALVEEVATESGLTVEYRVAREPEPQPEPVRYHTDLPGVRLARHLMPPDQAPRVDPPGEDSWAPVGSTGYGLAAERYQYRPAPTRLTKKG